MGNTPRQVALTGATGFVGSCVLKRLLGQGDRVRALVRDPNRLSITHDALEPLQGDLHNQQDLCRLVDGVEAVIHLVGIIVEHPRRGQTFERVHHQATARLLDAAGLAGVGRWVQMSAIGAREHAGSRYHTTKWRAEQAVRGSDLAWTVLRPSLIHGPDGEFTQLVRSLWVNRLPPFVPYFGGGLFGYSRQSLVQPVWVEDVARCFAQAPRREAAVGKTYDLVGPGRLTWPQLYRVFRKHMPGARRKPVLPVPAWLARLAAHLPGVPFTGDQVVMSREDNVGDPVPAERDFDFHFTALEDAVARYERG